MTIAAFIWIGALIALIGFNVADKSERSPKPPFVVAMSFLSTGAAAYLVVRALT